MDSQLRKELHAIDPSIKMETPLDTSHPSSVNSNEDPEFTHTIPTLVSELFLHNLRDVHLLKMCRLVSKRWDTEACKSLRACSKVTFRETSSEFLGFSMLTLKRAFGPLQHLASPFQNFHLIASTLDDPTFLEFALNTPITSISVNLGKVGQNNGSSVNYRQLLDLLAFHESNLTNLEFSSSHSRNDSVVESCPVIKTPELKYLKRLSFRDNCERCDHTQFVTKLVSRCAPEWLHLNVRDKVFVDLLLSQDQAENLKKLELCSCYLSMEEWSHLVNLRFLELRSLIFRMDNFDRRQDVIQLWHSFCQNVSPLLEEFETDLPICFEPKLSFPNLKSIKIIQSLAENRSSLSTLTPDMFPSLAQVQLWFPKLYDITIENEVPHRGVSSLDLRILDLYDENVDLVSENLMHLLTYASRQFPAVSSLTLVLRKFRHNTLPDIFESFPKIRTLSLDGKCDFSCLSGMNKLKVEKYLERGLSIEKVPRRKSITDFMELEVINFGPDVVVDPDIISCFSRVPKLRQINFDWAKSSPAPPGWNLTGHSGRTIFCQFARNHQGFF